MTFFHDSTIEQKIIVEIMEEYNRAVMNNGSFASAHEAWAVIKEEMDELWDEVKKRQTERDYDNMQKEATQIAAMAIRFIVDVCK